MTRPRAKTPATSAVLEPSRGWALPALCAVACAVRLGYLVEAMKSPLFADPPIDGAENLLIAQRVLHEGWPAGVVPFRPPLYPIWLAAVQLVTGSALLAPRVLQFLLGVVTCGLLFDLTRRRAGVRAGLAAGLLYALYAPAVFLECQIEIDSLVVPLATVALWILERGPAALSRSLAAGVVCALLAFLRPTTILLAPLLAVALAVRDPCRGSRRAAAALLLVALLPVCVFTVRNRLGSGHWIPISSNGGVNFFVGNNADFEATFRMRPGVEWEDLMDRSSQRAQVGAGAIDSSPFFYGEAFRFARQDPAAFAGLLGRKALLFLGDYELSRNQSFRYHRGESSVLGALPVHWAPVLSLAALAAYLFRRRWRGLALPYAVVAYGVLANVLIFPCDRYRLPSFPALAMLAVLAAVELGRAFERERARTLLIGATVGLATIGLCLDPGRASALDRYRVDYYLAEAHLNKGRLDDAESSLARAEQLDPLDPDAATLRAFVALERRDLAAVLRATERALTLAPSNGRAYYVRGLAQRRSGDDAGAVASFERALAVRRTLGNLEPSLRTELGLALVQVGRPADAVTELEIASRRRPGDAAVALGLATALALGDPARAVERLDRSIPRGVSRAEVYGRLIEQLARWPERIEPLLAEAARARRDPDLELVGARRAMTIGDAAAGERHARAALALRADDPEAWNTLGVCLAAQRQFAGARRALERALTLRPDLEAARYSLDRLPK